MVDLLGRLSDNEWHTVEIYRKDINTVLVTVDELPPVEKKLSSGILQFDHSNVMYLGGRLYFFSRI